MATVPRTPSHPGTVATPAAEPRRVCPSTAARPKLVAVPVFSLAVPSPDPLSRVLVGIPIELSVDTLGHTLAHGAHTYRCTVGGSKARAAAAPGECGRGGRGRRQAMRLSGLRPARTGVRQEGAHGQGLAGQGERGPGAAWLGRRPVRVLDKQRPELPAGVVTRGTAVACVLIAALHADASPCRSARCNGND